MKKLFALLLALTLCLGLCACGGEAAPVETQPAATEAPVVVTEAPVEEAAPVELKKGILLTPGKLVGLIVGVVVLVAILVGAVVAGMGGFDKTDASDPVPTTEATVVPTYAADTGSTLTQTSYGLEGNEPNLSAEGFNQNAPTQTLVITLGTPGIGFDVQDVFEKVLDAYSLHTFLVTVENVESVNEPDPIDLEKIYEEVFSLEKGQIDQLKETLTKDYQRAGETFTEEDEEDKHFLQLFSFICMLSYDIFIRKQIIEKIVDSMPKQPDKKS